MFILHTGCASAHIAVCVLYVCSALSLRLLHHVRIVLILHSLLIVLYVRRLRSLRFLLYVLILHHVCTVRHTHLLHIVLGVQSVLIAPFIPCARMSRYLHLPQRLQAVLPVINVRLLRNVKESWFGILSFRCATHRQHTYCAFLRKLQYVRSV